MRPVVEGPPPQNEPGDVKRHHRQKERRGGERDERDEHDREFRLGEKKRNGGGQIEHAPARAECRIRGDGGELNHHTAEGGEHAGREVARQEVLRPQRLDESRGEGVEGHHVEEQVQRCHVGEGREKHRQGAPRKGVVQEVPLQPGVGVRERLLPAHRPHPAEGDSAVGADDAPHHHLGSRELESEEVVRGPPAGRASKGVIEECGAAARLVPPDRSHREAAQRERPSEEQGTGQKRPNRRLWPVALPALILPEMELPPPTIATPIPSLPRRPGFARCSHRKSGSLQSCTASQHREGSHVC
mmetsp:Transcript_30227/g.71901  ORF Transcript_30227/g.71901 Transcript_30227/m.71901 type:complete len:301 (-) Transcript_30227:228-1130(-)